MLAELAGAKVKVPVTGNGLATATFWQLRTPWAFVVGMQIIVTDCANAGAANRQDSKNIIIFFMGFPYLIWLRKSAILPRIFRMHSSAGLLS